MKATGAVAGSIALLGLASAWAQVRPGVDGGVLAIPGVDAGVSIQPDAGGEPDEQPDLDKISKAQRDVIFFEQLRLKYVSVSGADMAVKIPTSENYLLPQLWCDDDRCRPFVAEYESGPGTQSKKVRRANLPRPPFPRSGRRRVPIVSQRTEVGAGQAHDRPRIPAT